MAPSGTGKRGPTVLVTDAREQLPPFRRQPSRSIITVDNILQYASEIPSMQQRQPGARMVPVRTPSGRPFPQRVRLTGQFAQQHMPNRSSKTSEKLVYIPEAKGQGDQDEKADFDEDNERMPLRDDEEERRSASSGGKSFAERLPKAKRTERFSRATAYCTAQAFKMRWTTQFLKDKHEARTKLYDDCLYTVYQLPLQPGNDGYRVKSSPVLKAPGGKTVLDEEIERSERRDHHDWGETFGTSPELTAHREAARSNLDQHLNGHSEHDHESGTSTPDRVAPDAFTFGEMFVFSYGVVVFWNFTEHQEKDILADLTFSAHDTGVSLVTQPLDEEDFETEEFHFEYAPEVARPRVFNDMITLKSGDHMIKLSISHAIAQSTKLIYFEEQIKSRMEEVMYVPKRLALTGQLGLQRMDVVKILGGLFKSRVDVNLSSNMLDTPTFFWESEPTLRPLYEAVREYLEIKPRIQILNERCRVFLDLTEILSDSIADSKTSRQTWIIIVLIILSILVTCSEVFLRFGILSRKVDGNRGDPTFGGSGGILGSSCVCEDVGGLGIVKDLL